MALRPSSWGGSLALFRRVGVVLFLDTVELGAETFDAVSNGSCPGWCPDGDTTTPAAVWDGRDPVHE